MPGFRSAWNFWLPFESALVFFLRNVKAVKLLAEPCRTAKVRGTFMPSAVVRLGPDTLHVYDNRTPPKVATPRSPKGSTTFKGQTN
jgi:hypothetical protein